MTRPARAALAAALLPAAALLAGSPLPSAAADTTPVPGDLTVGVGATVSLDVPVPDGVRPVRITGELAVEAPDADDLAEVRVEAGDRLVATVDPEPGRISFPVRAADVDRGAGVIPLRVTLVPDDQTGAGGACPDVPEGVATLDDLQLTVAGQEAEPRTLADFFAPTVSRVDVVVDRSADDDLLAAALGTVAAVSSRYGASVPVALRDDVRRASGTGHRVIRLEGGTGETTTTLDRSSGVPTLTVAGAPDGLAGFVAAIASRSLGLTGGAVTTGLTATPRTVEEVDEISFADLGSGFASLAGFGRVEQYLRVRQDSFGGTVDSLHLSLRGTHVAVPDGTQARFDTRVNGVLLDSVALDGSDDLEIEVDVPTSVLVADNSVVFALVSAPGTDRCGVQDAPAPEVTIDPDASTVSVRHGDGPGGFTAFPQAFQGEVTVAFGDAATDRWTAARDAAGLVSAVQREATLPLAVEVRSLDDALEDAPAATLAVYPSARQAADLGLALRSGAVEGFGVDDLTVEVDRPYAALESGRTGEGDRVVTLTSWGGSGDAGPSSTSSRLVRTVLADGWTSLTGDLYLVAPGSDPRSYDSGAAGYPEESSGAVDEDAPDDDDASGGPTVLGQAVAVAILTLLLVLVAVGAFRLGRGSRRPH